MVWCLRGQPNERFDEVHTEPARHHTQPIYTRTIWYVQFSFVDNIKWEKLTVYALSSCVSFFPPKKKPKQYFSRRLNFVSVYDKQVIEPLLLKSVLKFWNQLKKKELNIRSIHSLLTNNWKAISESRQTGLSKFLFSWKNRRHENVSNAYWSFDWMSMYSKCDASHQ